jgi:hypothetical protein
VAVELGVWWPSDDAFEDALEGMDRFLFFRVTL